MIACGLCRDGASSLASVNPSVNFSKSLVILFLAGCAASSYSDDMNSPFESDFRKAQRSHRLIVYRPLLSERTDLHLLTGTASIELDAELIQVEPLPNSLRETSRKVRWHARAGELSSYAGDRRARAVWYPPLESQTVELEVEAWTRVEPREPSSGAQAQTIYHRRTFRFLPPLSSIVLSGGRIEGYEIGLYPDPADPTLQERFKIESRWHELHPERYRMPEGFYKVDAENRDLRISPHLSLGQFAIDYPWGSLGMPQYIALDMNLVNKLEDLIELMEIEGGYEITTLTPIYGFRPPSFNLGSIESNPDTNLKVPFSMHQYGRALDFIIDEDGDLVMDDLNGDGVHDMHDAAEIMHYVNILDRKYRAQERWGMVGGAGLYDRHDFGARPQTSYVHVDTRGFLRENGTLVRWPRQWPDGAEIKWGEM